MKKGRVPGPGNDLMIYLLASEALGRSSEGTRYSSMSLGHLATSFAPILLRNHTRIRRCIKIFGLSRKDVHIQKNPEGEL